MKHKKKETDDALQDVPLSCDIRLHCDYNGCIAIPEVHTGQVECELDLGEPEDEGGICYNTVAVPEIYLGDFISHPKNSSKSGD